MKLSPKLNLQSRGAILVGFTLVCHLLFVITLGLRLNQIQNYMLAETVSENIIRNGLIAITSMVSQSLDDFMAMRQGRMAYAEQAEQLNVITHKVNEFVKLIYNDPKHKAGLMRFQNAVKNVTETLIQFGKLQETTDDWRRRNHPLERTMYSQGPELIDAMSAILTTEHTKFIADASAIESSIASLLTGVTIFAGLNIAIAAGLGVSFALMISNPLAHVRANGKRLSNRQPLLPPLKDSAEFSKLDSLLHATSASLKEALLRNEELLQNAADTIISLNEKGEILSINMFGMKLLGFEMNELIGRSIFDVVVPDQCLDADTYLRNTIESAKTAVFELQLVDRLGVLIDTRWSCYWSDQHEKIFAVVHDISEQKRLEELKEDFANMISHDLRSPLMAMHNSLSLIVMGVKGEVSEQSKADLRRGLANIDHLMQLVNDLLDFKKLKAGKIQLEKEKFNLREAVLTACDLLSGFAEERTVQICPSNNALDVVADKQKMIQVSTNLISNAIKFSPPNETVYIDYQNVTGGFELTVRDRGRGITEENRIRIFEIFEQGSVADEKQGTGLGLAICKLIAEAHGGKVWAESGEESQESRGSVFRVFIPHESGQAFFLK